MGLLISRHDGLGRVSRWAGRASGDQRPVASPSGRPNERASRHARQCSQARLSDGIAIRGAAGVGTPKVMPDPVGDRVPRATTSCGADHAIDGSARRHDGGTAIRPARDPAMGNDGNRQDYRSAEPSMHQKALLKQSTSRCPVSATRLRSDSSGTPLAPLRTAVVPPHRPWGTRRCDYRVVWQCPLAGCATSWAT